MEYKESDAKKNYRYFLIQRPRTIGGLPSNIQIKDAKDFDVKTFVPTIGQEAWGYIESEKPIEKTICLHYGLKQSYDFREFLDSNAFSMRKISPFYFEKEEDNWLDENNKIIEKISNEFSGDYLFVKKEIEKMGRVEILYFAIDETLIKVDEFIVELTGRYGVDFGADSQNKKFYINLYQNMFSSEIEGEKFCGYNMEKYCIEDRKKDDIPPKLNKYIMKQIDKGMEVIPLPSCLFDMKNSCKVAVLPL